jgi:hypothetical protein
MRTLSSIVLSCLLAALLAAPAHGGDRSSRGFESLPALSDARPTLELVGDADNQRLGVTIVSDTEAVAYLCDGEQLGVWFTGAVDPETGVVSLRSTDGATVGLNLNDEPTVASVAVDGKTTSFTLERVTRSGGLYRSVIKAKGHRYTTGWIVADDGTTVGITEDQNGKTVATVNTTDAGTPPPPTGDEGSGGDEVATAGALRCGLLAFRSHRQNGLATQALEAGNTSGFNDHGHRAAALGHRAEGLGCAT